VFQGKGVIGSLWQAFFAHNVMEQIPHKADNAILSLYYDYAGDKNGDYSVLIGVRVTHIDTLLSGLVAVKIPAGKAYKFVSQRGQSPQVVIDTWQKIWTLEDAGQLPRAYGVDYEQHDERSHDPANAQVDIIIGAPDHV
jgi:predicted transcriptional regulator YdeE